MVDDTFPIQQRARTRMVAKAVVQSYLKAHPEIMERAMREAVEQYTVGGTGWMQFLTEDANSSPQSPK